FPVLFRPPPLSTIFPYTTLFRSVVTRLHVVYLRHVLVPLYPVQLVSLPLYGYLLRFSLESDYLCLQALSAYSLVLVAYSPIQFSTARFLRLIALDLKIGRAHV